MFAMSWHLTTFVFGVFSSGVPVRQLCQTSTRPEPADMNLGHKLACWHADSLYQLHVSSADICCLTVCDTMWRI